MRIVSIIFFLITQSIENIFNLFTTCVNEQDYFLYETNDKISHSLEKELSKVIKWKELLFINVTPSVPFLIQ